MLVCEPCTPDTAAPVRLVCDLDAASDAGSVLDMIVYTFERHIGFAIVIRTAKRRQIDSRTHVEWGERAPAGRLEDLAGQLVKDLIDLRVRVQLQGLTPPRVRVQLGLTPPPEVYKLAHGDTAILHWLSLTVIRYLCTNFAVIAVTFRRNGSVAHGCCKCSVRFV